MDSESWILLVLVTGHANKRLAFVKTSVKRVSSKQMLRYIFTKFTDTHISFLFVCLSGFFVALLFSSLVSRIYLQLILLGTAAILEDVNIGSWSLWFKTEAKPTRFGAFYFFQNEIVLWLYIVFSSHCKTQHQLFFLIYRPLFMFQVNNLKRRLKKKNGLTFSRWIFSHSYTAQAH